MKRELYHDIASIKLILITIDGMIEHLVERSQYEKARFYAILAMYEYVDTIYNPIWINSENDALKCEIQTIFKTFFYKHRQSWYAADRAEKTAIFSVMAQRKRGCLCYGMDALDTYIDQLITKR